VLIKNNYNICDMEDSIRLIDRDHAKFKNKCTFASSLMQFIFNLQQGKIDFIIYVQYKRGNTLTNLFAITGTCSEGKKWLSASGTSFLSTEPYTRTCPRTCLISVTNSDFAEEAPTTKNPPLLYSCFLRAKMPQTKIP
jgi:hypothetical protein